LNSETAEQGEIVHSDMVYVVIFLITVRNINS